MILVALVAVYFRIDIAPPTGSAREKLARVDFTGALALIACVTLFISGMTLGGNVLDWDDPLILTILPCSALFLAYFIYNETKTTKSAILPIHILLQRNPLSTSLANWFMSMVAFSIMYNLPLFYQVVLGISSGQAGIRLIPNSIGGSLSSLSAGLIMAKTVRPESVFYYNSNATNRANITS